MRVDLNVPYAEREEAKRLGAWWDRAKRVWFVVSPEDLTPFMRWHRPTEYAPTGKKHRRNSSKPILIKGAGTLLPTCDCHSPPWEHCPHTSGSPA